MKGNPKLIEVLNELLSDELSAVNQYIVHAEMCEDWGYGKLHDKFKKRAIEEMRHAEILIGRILFLDGTPDVARPIRVNIGDKVPGQIENDRASEEGAVKAYNDAIALASEVKDHATRDILIKILNDEDRHLDELEETLDQIEQMSAPIYLSTQVSSKESGSDPHDV